MRIAKTVFVFLAAWFVLSVVIASFKSEVHHHHYYGTPGPMYVSSPPPAPRDQSRTDRPTEDHIWISGHWDWDEGSGDWVWVEGAWEIPPDEGASWEEPEYEENEGDWIYTPGHWIWFETGETGDVDDDAKPDDPPGKNHGHHKGRRPGIKGPGVIGPGAGHDTGRPEEEAATASEDTRGRR